MFNNDIRVESVPKRVFEFCKIVSQNQTTVSEVKQKMFPKSIANGGDDYFNYTMKAAIELQLVDKIDNEKLLFLGDKNNIKSLSEFRLYCNSMVWKDKYTLFYRIAVAFLESNLEWLKNKDESFTQNSNIRSEIRRQINMEDSSLSVHILGERFWLSFLGFGYIFESSSKFLFLPNMYVALKDFIIIANFEKNVEMTIREFLMKMYSFGSVGFLQAFESDSKNFNYAFSTALRCLHDNKEIVLKRNSDSEEIWNLFPLDSHEFEKEITHVIIRGMRK